MSKILKFFLVCFGIATISFLFGAEAQAANVQFTEDTQLDLSGAPATLYVASGSACDLLTVSPSALNVDVPPGNAFTLKTATLIVLGLTPFGGRVTLDFNTSYFSTGYVAQWTVSSLVSNAQVSFLVGVPQTNTDYLIRVNGDKLGYFQSNSSGQISFTYGGFSSKIFTITQENRPVSAGGGMPGGWLMPPKPPEGGFKILINDEAIYTNSKLTTLKLTGGSDTQRMAISNFSDFRDAGQENYVTTKEWNLCKGLTFCPEGKYTVYAKFYAPWGTVSGVVSDSIVYKITPTKREIEREKLITETLTKMIEVLKKLIQLYTELIQVLKG